MLKQNNISELNNNLNRIERSIPDFNFVLLEKLNNNLNRIESQQPRGLYAVYGI